MVDQKLFESLEWRSIGPHRGGRVVAVAGHPTEKETFFFGACAGGVFKTEDAGAHWFNVTDGYFNTAAIGAIAISHHDPNVIYVGTGETAIRSNVSHGDGVYKSTDGGRTWQNMGLAETRHIGQIQIHPDDPDTVFVAALGHAWGPNEERGVYRSTDGGETWAKVLYKSEKAGAIDISMDPSNPRMLYAAFWEGQRFPWAATSGGWDSGIWRSRDGGDTWEDITRNPGLPESMLGKIGVAASPAKAGRVWAVIEAEDGALFRSDDGGDTWQRQSENMDLRRRAWYYMHIFADPSDAETVWVLNLQCWKSSDGGKTFEAIPTPHGDNHGLWIDPEDSDRLIEGNDGGACVSYNGGESWSTILNQPTAQFYHVIADDQIPYHVYGSQQDNWGMRLPSISFEGAITWKDYVEPGGGESGHIAVKPSEPYTVFGGGIGTGPGHGRLRAWNPQTRQARNVTAWPEVHGFGSGAGELKYRFQWTFPVNISPHDPETLYVCSNHVHRSTDEGASWEVISPDLTRNDPEKQKPSGGPITIDNSGAEIYCTIFAFAESPHEQGVFWTGSDDGLIHVSRDGGGNWDNVTPGEDLLPEWARIMIIEPSLHDASTVYVAATRYQLDDTSPYLLKTDDYGASWTLITSGIPENEFTRTIREDPVKQGLLFTGTETGIYVSFDDGQNWQLLQSSPVRGAGRDIPVVPVHDLIIKDGDLVAATHGRSFWILDDMTPLRQIKDGVDTGKPHLFQPRDTTRFRINQGLGWGEAGMVSYMMTGPVTISYREVRRPNGEKAEEYLNAGKNPPVGVIVHYQLNEKPEGEVKLSILDGGGSTIRSFSSRAESDDDKAPAEQGANRFVWNMRGQTPTRLESDEPDDRRTQRMMAGIAPKVAPGEYRVKLEIDGVEQTQSFNVLPDPRLPVTQQDLQAQFDLKSSIRDAVSETHELINSIRRVRSQVDEWTKRAGENQEIDESGTNLKEKLDGVEGQLIVAETDKPMYGSNGVREKLATLSAMIDESDHAPTRQSHEVFSKLSDDLQTQKSGFRRVMDDDLASFTERLKSANVPYIAS